MVVSIMYDRQVVISIDNTDEHLLLCKKWQFSHNKYKENFDVIMWEGGNVFTNISALRKVTPNTRIYIIGHCMPGSSVLSKQQDLSGDSIDYSILGNFLIENIPFHCRVSLLRNITISLIACYGGLNLNRECDDLSTYSINNEISPDWSFALKFQTYLKKNNFNAKVLARAWPCLIYNPFDEDTRYMVRDLGYQYKGNAGRKASITEYKAYNSKDFLYKYAYFFEGKELKIDCIYGDEKNIHYPSNITEVFKSVMILEYVVVTLKQLSVSTKTPGKAILLQDAVKQAAQIGSISDVLILLKKLIDNPIIRKKSHFWTITSATESALKSLLKSISIQS